MEHTGVLDRLFSSFHELETAIGSAKETLARRGGVPAEVIKRLDSYDGILAKQRNLAAILCEHITSGNWDEVNRHVNLINGLSALIRDDARAILSALSVNSDIPEADEATNFC